MKKIIKSRLFYFILGGIIFTSITVFAAVIAARDVSFIPKDPNWNVDNIEDAMNELININGSLKNIYGIKRSLDSSSTTWERLGESVGKVANAQIGTTSVRNDFDNIYPWSEIKSYDYDTDNQQITAWYGESDFSFKPSGNIEVLTYVPEFYYMRMQSGGYEFIFISPNAREGFVKSEAFSIGRYLASGNSNRLHSKSDVDPLNGATIANFRSYAKKSGTGFGLLDYRYFTIQLLYLVEYADYNIKSVIGPGYGYKDFEAPLKSGGCDDLGMHSGSADGTYSSSIIYRGMEDIYGNLFEFMDGINVKDKQIYINYDPTTYASDTFTGNYKKISYMYSGDRGYIKRLGFDAENPLIAFPVLFSDSPISLIGYSMANTGNRVVIVGGCYQYDDEFKNLWTIYYNNPSSYKSDKTGVRLLKYN